MNKLFIQFSTNDCLDLLKQITRPILTNLFKNLNQQVILMLTDSYLVLFTTSSNNTPTHYCRLNFSIKSQFLFESISNLSDQSKPDLNKPYGIKFQKQNCNEYLTLTSQSTNILYTWMVELQKKINQRNFHKLFKAKKKIGKGAFATVYLAERLRDNKMVAVKAFLKQKQYSGDKGRDSLENQINLMRHINHQNIMKLQAVYQTQNSIYVILQYLQGVQLNDIIKNKKNLTEDQKISIIRNLLKGLEYLSQNRIIHRDLKPQNIMFRNHNFTDAVICDLGLATFADAEKYLFVRCGTPGFVSPQIINIKDMTLKSDPISDVFSAGLIFHYLLFGQSIFSGKKYSQILTQNRACEFDFNLQLYSSIDQNAFDLLKRMLEKDPKKRITSKIALNHPYFKKYDIQSSKMQIQQSNQIHMISQNRGPFKQLSNYKNTSVLKNIQTIQTPSIFPSQLNKFGYNLIVNRNINEKNYRV